MDHFEGVVLDYLRADRALFVNSQCCIQLNEGANPDTRGPHWYYDAVAVSFKEGRLICAKSATQLGPVVDCSPEGMERALDRRQERPCARQRCAAGLDGEALAICPRGSGRAAARQHRRIWQPS
ncbi:hypothetical protein CPBF367_34790 [Xanthomonas arboricola pv. juglandis]|nr:hypothetical protein CPBF367_34790 [Xanthomonas arboricola pv. juglandis]